MNRFSSSSNSQVEFYLSLACSMLRSIHDLPSYDGSAKEADVRACIAGVESLGLSFLTVVLPEYGKAIDRGLETGRLEPPSRLKRSLGHSIPLFIRSIVSSIYSSDGSLLPDASALALKHARQLCFSFYKLETGYSRKLEEKVLQSFIENDECNLVDGDDRLLSPLVKESAYLTETIMEGFDPLTEPFRHGPGAVATGEMDEEKWTFNRVYSHLDEYFPFHETFVVGPGELADRREHGAPLDFIDEASARVILVPKDSRGPRIISCEPLEIQYVQQALGRSLMAWLESHFMTQGLVNFTDQRINRSLALESSVTRDYATLDLKDASDMVSLALIRRIFASSPRYLDLWLAARSRSTSLPNGKSIRLKKFAPMGSALCFPVESFVFWVISVAAIAASLRTEHPRLSLAARQLMARKYVWVYGDDIIVRTRFALCVMDALESVGLRVNRHKSFILGSFRESCGMDAFKGIDVTPTRFKSPWTGADTDARAYASYIAYANALTSKGYSEAASFLWDSITSVYGSVPYGLANTAFPCRIVGSRTEARYMNRAIGIESRWYRKTQVEQILVNTLEPASRQRVDDGWGRLLSSLTRGGSASFLRENWATYWDVDDRGVITAFRDRLDRRKVVSRRSISIKRRWTSV